MVRRPVQDEQKTRHEAAGDLRGGRQEFAARGLAAKRSFGQCFLADPNIARIIAQEATTPAGGTTLEIGAGTGALTAPLLDRAARVIAIERDRDLVPVLRATFAGAIEAGRLVVVEADAVSADWASLVAEGPEPRILAGNIPYQITGRILQRAVEHAGAFQRAVFLVQKEVAQRLAAKPGTKDYGAMTVFVRSRFAPSLRVVVPASCFRPKPRIDSAVVVLRASEPVPGCRGSTFEELVACAFSKRRKTLRNAWAGAAGLEGTELERAAKEAGVDLDARGESLTVEQFGLMARAIDAR